jgi:alkanesulfonate monooxygenase SsuD/methylene tetrahydromethanopterin reductase-like flavin-dependent oxidoreductase (luciferase family)
VEFVRTEAGERFDSLELNLFITAVTLTAAGAPDVSTTRQVAPELSVGPLLRLPGVLVGSEHQIAEQLLHYRETFGLTYFSVLEPHMDDFAKVMDRLR